jgi:NAD(P)-dependent dehydrogenase (short-subunit alcohol dehydrogenase family)
VDGNLSLGFTPGDTVIVTGAGSGIGRAIAGTAARAGLRVAAWDLVADAVADTVAAIARGGGAAVAVTADVSDPAAVAAALDASGPARYLVNNAGPANSAPLDFDRALTLTAGSVRLVTESWLSRNPPAGAALVNIASVAGNFVGTDSPWYSAGKAAIVGYTRHLAAHHALRVRANAIAPGAIDTPRMAGFEETDLGRSLVARNPLRRMGSPEDIAGAALFLLSPLAGYVNGVLLPVDGGWMVAQ